MVGGKLGANCFFTISSYYLLQQNSKNNYKSKILKTHNVLWFYSILFLIVNMIFRIKIIEIIDILESIMPLVYNSYWFISSYILLLIFCPIFNIVIEKLDENKYKKILLILFIIITINAFVPKANILNDPQHFIVTICIYFLVGFINRFKNNKLDQQKLKLVLCSSLSFIIFSSFAMLFIGNKLNMNILIMNSHIMMSGESIFIISAAVSLFYLFLNKKRFTNGIINQMGNSTFDVYLIHMNHLIYMWIWNDLFKIKILFKSQMFPIYAIIIASTVFIITDFIGILRNIMFIYVKKIYNVVMKGRNKYYEKNKTIFDCRDRSKLL